MLSTQMRKYNGRSTFAKSKVPSRYGSQSDKALALYEIAYELLLNPAKTDFCPNVRRDKLGIQVHSTEQSASSLKLVQKLFLKQTRQLHHDKELELLFYHHSNAWEDKDIVMSDSEDSTVTYIVVSSPFADLPDIGSPGVDGPTVMPEDPYAYVVGAFQALPSPDYVSGLEYPPLPEFVSEPVYPEFMPPEDEILPAKEQPLPTTLSPAVYSPGYEDPNDYPADEGDDGDDEDELSDDDEDEDVDIEEDEEEEEHPTPADSITIALQAVDQAPYAEDTEPFETDESAATPPPHPAYWVTARILIRDEPPTSLWSDTEVARLLAIPTPPPSPLSPWSSQLPQIPSPPLPLILSPLPVSPPLPVSSPPPASPIRSLEVTLPPRKRLGIALGPRYEVGESSSTAARSTRGLRIDYGFVATNGQGNYAGSRERCRQDTDEIYTRLDDEQSERQLMAGRLNMLYRDRCAHAHTARLMEAEARMSREAWGRSMDASDLVCTEVMSLHTQVVAQQAVIIALQAADHKRQAAIDVGGRPQETRAVHRGTKTAEETSDSYDRV
ncbi:hypothetical protein Tco_0098285 [Tanacetum coccineum]